MKSIEDAMALCDKEQDPFYLDAFLIEAWLGHVVLEATAEYAEKKNAKDRALQTGQAWRGFLEVFGHARDEDFHLLMGSVYRFCEYDDVQSAILCRAIGPLMFEGECFSNLIRSQNHGGEVPQAKAVGLLRRSMERWCDWIDTVVHFDTHFQHRVLPESHDPDPEKRELAALGVMQRSFAKLSASDQAWWEWHHREAAGRFKDSPKWQTIGKLAVAPLRTAPADLDEIVILFWPLMKRHNWTYRDLMAVACQVLPLPHHYPLEREQDLAAYCSNVLGLRKQDGPPGKSNPDGRPPGYEVAFRLCRREPPSSSS
jgi:hypothetical protein